MRTPAVVTHPGMLGGTPHLEGHRLAAADVADRFFQLGMDEVEAMWDVDHDDVIVCCWWVARYGTRAWRRRWGAWLKEYDRQLWAGEWHIVQLPPREESP